MKIRLGWFMVWLVVVGIVLAGMVMGMGAQPAYAQDDGPEICEVGIYLLAVDNFDLQQHSFNAKFWIWSLCPTADSPLDRLDIINAMDYSTSLRADEQIDDLYYSYMKIEGTFYHSWDLRNYPFDEQRLELVFEDALNIASFVYVADDDQSGYKKDMPLQGWTVADYSLTLNETVYDTTFGNPTLADEDIYSRLNVQIHLQRDEVTGFLQLVILAYVAFVVSLLAYLLNTPPNEPKEALSLLLSTLFVVTLSLRSANASLGQVDGLTLVDKVHISVLLYILMALLVSFYTRYAFQNGQPVAVLKQNNRRVLILSLVSFSIINAFLISSAIS